MITQIIANGLVAGSACALVALGFGIIFRVCGFFNLAHGAVYTVGAYVAYALVQLCGWPQWIGILSAIVGGGCLGSLMEIGIYKPLRRSGASSLSLLICSLGIMVAIQNGVSLIFGDGTKRLRAADVYESVTILGAHVTSIQIVTIGTGVLLCAAVFTWMQLSRLGKMASSLSDLGEERFLKVF